MAQEDLAWHVAASTHLLEARKKNGRLRGKKSRAGCLVCKGRRVKCDEQKPECERCRSTDRRCDYAGTSPSPGSSTPPLIDSLQPQFSGLKDAGRRKLDFFISAAAPQLAGVLDREFWCNYALQLAQVEPCVTESLLAISTLYEHPQFLASFYRDSASDASPSSSDSSERLDRFHADALIHYNSAIQAFKSRMAEGKATPLLALLSCGLFLCIEFIRDNIYGALELYVRGSGLLAQYGSATAKGQDDSLLKLIKHMFGRLGAWVPALAHPELLEMDQVHADAHHRDDFQNVSEARTTLFALMTRSNMFVKDAYAWRESLLATKMQSHEERKIQVGDALTTMYGVTFRMVMEGEPQRQHAAVPKGSPTASQIVSPSTSADSAPQHIDANGHGKGITDILEQLQSNAAPPATYIGSMKVEEERLIYQQAQLLESLNLWYHTFENLNRRQVQIDLEATSYLLMYYHATMIWLSTRLQPAQTDFDKLTPHFKELVQHAETYLNIKATELPTFTFEIGVTPPLLLAAAKCRIPSLRRRALYLLSRAPKKEGMHGSASTAEFTRRLIEIEEEGLGLPLPNLRQEPSTITVDDTIIPSEDRRIHSLELLRNLSTQSYEIKLQRHAETAGALHINVDYVPL